MIVLQVDALWGEAYKVRMVLEQLGHTVITLAGIGSSCHVTPDLVLLDLRPGDGCAHGLLQQARARWARPTLVVSHYLSDACGLADGFLHKLRVSHESLGSALARLQAA